MSNKQVQTSGGDSTNIQAGTMVVNVGIDERRAREIYQEMSFQLRKEYFQEALNIANARVEQFEDRLMPKMEAVDGALEAFADPSFQLLLLEAQKTAAATERPADYDLLSELLIHRFQKGGDRVMRSGISRAVEIVDSISDDALLGLTVAHSMSAFLPATGDITQGLNVLNDLYGKMLYGKLPEGQEWIDHLDILDAIRVNPFGGLKKIRQYYAEMLPGYVDIGIEKNSDNHAKALDLLGVNGLPADILVDHYFNECFVQVNVPRRNEIGSFQLNRRVATGSGFVVHSTPVSDEQINAINSIYDLYSQDAALKNKNVDAFIEEWDKRANLKLVREWWEGIPIAFQVTTVGKVLAHSNAQRCDKSLPPLNQ